MKGVRFLSVDGAAIAFTYIDPYPSTAMNILKSGLAREFASYPSVVKILLLVSLAAGNACTSDRKTIDTGNATNPPRVDDLKPYPESSVGREASNYRLRMDRVREWYSVVGDVNQAARSDSTLRIRLEYPFASALAPHVDQLERIPGMVTILKKHEMSTKEFVLLATLINTGWGAIALVDSLGPAGTPINVGPNLIDFMRTNRRELDSLRARSEGH
jgi:hypothetical protein